MRVTGTVGIMDEVTTMIDRKTTRPLPPPEERAANVRALGTYDILDTGAEAAFDPVVVAAARLLRAPTALISLLDAERQWFKARIGMDCAQTPLGLSLCRFAAASDEPMVVLDAAADPTFRDNPLVTGEMGIRFYAGAPLRMDTGAVIGTLCVIDHAPRGGCDAADLEALSGLAAVTAELIALRATARTLARTQDFMLEAS